MEEYTKKSLSVRQITESNLARSRQNRRFWRNKTYPECSNFSGNASGSRSYSLKNNFIRDLSELIPPFWHNYLNLYQKGGINSPKQLTSLSFRKLWAH